MRRTSIPDGSRAEASLRRPARQRSPGIRRRFRRTTGRILAVMKEKAPVAMTYSDGIAWGNAWVVIKGSPHAKLAMEAINYAISEEAQLRLLDAGTYGPALTSAAAKATPEQQKALVTAPDNAKKMLIINEEQAAQYSAKYEAEWNRFQLA